MTALLLGKDGSGLRRGALAVLAGLRPNRKFRGQKQRRPCPAANCAAVPEKDRGPRPLPVSVMTRSTQLIPVAMDQTFSRQCRRCAAGPRRQEIALSR